MQRREFIQIAALSGIAGVSGNASFSQAQEEVATVSDDSDRTYWLNTLDRIARPVMKNLATNHLKANMPVESPSGNLKERRQYAHLEAFGRTMSGIAPWLELRDSNKPEASLRHQYLEWAKAGLANATHPDSPDYMSFHAGGQSLVDAATLAHALLRSRKSLWNTLDDAVQNRVISAMRDTRSIKPHNNNWLLFSAMIETFLAATEQPWNVEPIDLAVRNVEDWYLGDGNYGDGPEFHWDYYNSLVIHPWYRDILATMSDIDPRWNHLQENAIGRARRYAAIQERLIAPDGSYPAIGRSLAYRCGVFHLLAQSALLGDLPNGISPAQVRCALTAVIQRTLEPQGTFDQEGWLQVGLSGHQPAIAEPYINTGSLYACSLVLLPLGKPPGDEFWESEYADWSSRRIWSGMDTPPDHAL